ncbi:hypothetical protein MMC06_006031 [Schaereria dolodes]|nr:hypothetical protein [Schaereria dolodes]
MSLARNHVNLCAQDNSQNQRIGILEGRNDSLQVRSKPGPVTVSLQKQAGLLERASSLCFPSPRRYSKSVAKYTISENSHVNGINSERLVHWKDYHSFPVPTFDRNGKPPALDSRPYADINDSEQLHIRTSECPILPHVKTPLNCGDLVIPTLACPYRNKGIQTSVSGATFAFHPRELIGSTILASSHPRLLKSSRPEISIVLPHLINPLSNCPGDDIDPLYYQDTSRTHHRIRRTALANRSITSLTIRGLPRSQPDNDTSALGNRTQVEEQQEPTALSLRGGRLPDHAPVPGRLWYLAGGRGPPPATVGKLREWKARERERIRAGNEQRNTKREATGQPSAQVKLDKKGREVRGFWNEFWWVLGGAKVENYRRRQERSKKKLGEAEAEAEAQAQQGAAAAEGGGEGGRQGERVDGAE